MLCASSGHLAQKTVSKPQEPALFILDIDESFIIFINFDEFMNKSKKVEAVRLGVHVSISGGIEQAIPRAEEIGCTSIQIFSRNPRGWRSGPLTARTAAEFRKRAADAAIGPVIVHTPYLLNLASGDEDLYRRSIHGLALDVRRAEQLGAQFVVTHVGSARERGFGVERVARALGEVLKDDPSVSILLENGAGAGHSLGGRFAEIQEIIATAGCQGRVGICFDTCHGFASGYDLRAPEDVVSLAKEINRTVGRKSLALLHLNDCLGGVGSHLDRHAHIGQGKIGRLGFENLLRHPFFRGFPMILETPKDEIDSDSKNMKKIKEIYFSSPRRR